MIAKKNLRVITLLLSSALLLNGCEYRDQWLIIGAMIAGAAVSSLDDDDDDDGNTDSNTQEKQSFEIHSVQAYDGVSDDLLTAGVGQNGLTAPAPTAADPVNPTAAEIRKATIINQYQALQDMRAASGYGTLYGPAVPTKFATTPSAEGKVAGKEYLAYADEGSGQKNVTMMVHKPDNFDYAQPCIVAAPSPGARGVYAGIVTVGEWGLKTRCAVAYTDKGTGNGVHDLSTDTVNLIDGTRGAANDVGNKANFRAQGTSQMDLAAYNSTHPFRIAQKAAHSQQNPEADGGKNVLDAIAFAFYVLNLAENLQEKSTLTSANTLVIASGISSGGAASLRAAEQDSQSLIDGIVVAAPMINPRDFQDAEGVTIEQGAQKMFYPSYRKSWFDVITYYNVFQPCASANTTDGLAGRCAALRNLGWLNNGTLSGQITEAQTQLNNYALTTTNAIAQHYETSNVYAGFANLYANAYGRFSVVDNLCGYSYAGSDGNEPPSAKSVADLADDFQTSSGLPPSSGTYLINNNGNDGKGIHFRNSVDANGNRDGYLDGALCLRQLATGTTGVTIDSGRSLTGTELEHYRRVQDGINPVFASGDLRGKPAIIVHGRDDALAHVNFSARAYFGLNQKTKQNFSQLVYIEVKNANHFDGLNEAYRVNTQIPLQYYLTKALDRMYDHLKNRAILPNSQVVPTKPLESVAESAAERLPDIGSANTCPMTFSNDVLSIPEC